MEERQRELLLFQLGPVQEFIAQARSTRDLWSGSYMLSWLVAHAICAVVERGGLDEDDVQMPSLANNPLVTALRDREVPLDLDKVLIPNLPNKALFAVPRGRAAELAAVAKKGIDDALAAMGESVWTFLAESVGDRGDWKTRWDAQLKAFPQVTWAWTDWDGSDAAWLAAYERVNRNLAARRNTRDFAQWQVACEEGPLAKDALSGKEEIIGDDRFWTGLHKRAGSLFKTPSHRYGAMNVVKRLWIRVDGDDEVLANRFFANSLNFDRRDVRGGLRVRSLPDIAKGNLSPRNPYVAVLAFDGDKMGETVKAHGTTPTGLKQVSQTLSTFALDEVRGVVETHGGFLVYAGGDDVLALLPASRAMACARAVRDAFRNAGTAAGYALEGSCGIAVGHRQAPLQMLVKEAQRMERVAKEKYNRGAVAVALYKRSGEIIEWGTRWEEGRALELLERTAELSQAGYISFRFPYALAALLRPYAFGSNPSMDAETMRGIMRREFEHVLGRQGSRLTGDGLAGFLPLVSAYLESVTKEEKASDGKPAGKPHPDDFMNLFLVEAFLNRERGED